jgi:hypothetical protein
MRIPDARRNPQPLSPPPHHLHRHHHHHHHYPHTEKRHARPEYVTSLRDDTSWSAADGVAAEPSQRPSRWWKEKQQG